MRYFVTVDGRSYDVELQGEAVIIDGQQLSAEMQQVAGTLLRRLSINGAMHRVIAFPGETRGQWHLHLEGERLTADVVDERTRAIRAMTARTARAQGPRPVRAPMPGMVVRVQVAVGDQVEAGQGVVIMEAMKMENELKADAAGVVSKLLVQEGTAVEKGAVLVEFAAEQHG